MNDVADVRTFVFVFMSRTKQNGRTEKYSTQIERDVRGNVDSIHVASRGYKRKSCCFVKTIKEVTTFPPLAVFSFTKCTSKSRFYDKS